MYVILFSLFHNAWNFDNEAKNVLYNFLNIQNSQKFGVDCRKI